MESQRCGGGVDAEGGVTVDEVPMFVAGDGAGGEEVAAVAYIGEQGLPGGLAEGLGRGEDDELGRAKLVDLILRDDVARLVQAIGEGANGVLLRLNLELRHHRVLRGLRSNNGDVGALRVDQIGRNGSS